MDQPSARLLAQSSPVSNFDSDLTSGVAFAAALINSWPAFAARVPSVHVPVAGRKDSRENAELVVRLVRVFDAVHGELNELVVPAQQPNGSFLCAVTGGWELDWW